MAADHWLINELSAGPIAARVSTLRVGSESTMRRIVARGSIQIEKNGDIDSGIPFAMFAPICARRDRFKFID
jgi:hypothetical protein